MFDKNIYLLGNSSVRLREAWNDMWKFVEFNKIKEIKEILKKHI